MNIITTERLDICKLSLKDAPFILKLLNTPSWLRFIGDRNVHSVEDARSYLEKGYLKSYETLGYGFYLLKLKETGTPVGICGLIRRDFLNDADIGFALLPEYEGKGYGYESSNAVLRYAIQELGMKRIVAITDSENVASQKLLEKLGLKYECMVAYPGDDEPLMLFGVTYS